MTCIEKSTATIAAAVILSFALSGHAEPNGVPLAPDESLTIGEYLTLGMPDLGIDWSRDQRSTARSIIRDLSQRRPLHLPRLASDRSGELFAKLIHEESFRRGLIEGALGERTTGESEELTSGEFARLVKNDSLAYFYTPEATGGLILDREGVEFAAQELSKVWSMRTEFEANLEDVEARHNKSAKIAEIAQQYRDSLQVAETLLVERLSMIATFAVTENFTFEAKADALSHFIEYAPLIAPKLTAEHRASFDELVQSMRESPNADPRLLHLSID